MEKNKKVVKNYVVCCGGGRGGLDEVLEVKSELSIEEYLKEWGEDDIRCRLEYYEEEEDKEYEREYLKEFRVGVVDKIESSKGFEVYGMSRGEEESVWMFEGDIDKLDDVVGLDELFEYLGIE